MVAWAGPSALPGSPAEVVAPTVAAQPVSAPTRTKADEVVAGSARMVLDGVGLTGSMDVAGTTPRPCGQPFAGWFGADAARGVDGKRSMTVTVSAWRAGVGPARYSDLVAATRACASVETTPGEDTFLANTAPAPGERTVAATRIGDVVAIIETATVASGSAALALQGVAVARKLLKTRMAGVCLEPSSTDRGDPEARDPYGDHYEGRKVRRDVALPVTSVISDPMVAVLTSQHGEPTWIAPAPREFADLAPLDLVAIGKSQFSLGPVGPTPTPSASGASADPPAGVLAVLPRLRAPRFVDPTALIPPTDVRGSKDPGRAPTLPAPVGDNARTEIPQADPGGPGCGWAFTGVRPPVIDPAALAAAARNAEIAAIATQSLRQADWLAATAKWPQDYRTWVVLRRAANNWARYEQTKQRAQTDFEKAQRDYLESVRRWQSGQYPRPGETRPPVPTPSATRTPSPTASSGGSTGPIPSGGASQ